MDPKFSSLARIQFQPPSPIFPRANLPSCIKLFIMAVPCSLTCTRCLRIESLQGSLPDINCEADVNCVFSQKDVSIGIVSVCHGGNSDDLVSIPAMTGTVAVNFSCLF